MLEQQELAYIKLTDNLLQAYRSVFGNLRSTRVATGQAILICFAEMLPLGPHCAGSQVHTKLPPKATSLYSVLKYLLEVPLGRASRVVIFQGAS